MKIQLNGKLKELPDQTILKTLIESLPLDPQTVISEVNEKIIKRDMREKTSLHEGDKVELVRFVGGG